MNIAGWMPFRSFQRKSEKHGFLSLTLTIPKPMIDSDCCTIGARIAKQPGVVQCEQSIEQIGGRVLHVCTYLLSP